MTKASKSGGFSLRRSRICDREKASVGRSESKTLPNLNQRRVLLISTVAELPSLV